MFVGGTTVSLQFGCNTFCSHNDPGSAGPLQSRGNRFLIFLILSCILHSSCQERLKYNINAQSSEVVSDMNWRVLLAVSRLQFHCLLCSVDIWLIGFFGQYLETVEMCSENALNLETFSSASCYIRLISITCTLYSMVQGSLDSR
jgi:hypothetical protein